MSTTSTVTVELESDVFLRLKNLAEPLVDTTSSVISRLLDEWEECQKSHKPSPRRQEQKVPDSASKTGHFVTSRGVAIPFGVLRAVYRPRGGQSQEFRAEVTSQGIEFDHKRFDNPSPAGVHAKQIAGAEGDAASTNGWEFWEYFDESSKNWVSIDVFRHPGA